MTTTTSEMLKDLGEVSEYRIDLGLGGSVQEGRHENRRLRKVILNDGGLYPMYLVLLLLVLRTGHNTIRTRAPGALEIARLFRQMNDKYATPAAKLEPQQ